MEATYDAFVSYDELTGAHNAEIIRESLNRKNISAFVAHLERPGYTGNFETLIDNVINKCKYFVLLITVDTLERPQVIREFKTAYPYRMLYEKPKLVIFHDLNAQRSIPTFVQETGVEISKINQQDFRDSSELATRVRLLFIQLLKPILDSSISLVELVNELRYLKPVLQDNSVQSLELGTILDTIDHSYHTLHDNLFTFATLSFDTKENLEKAKEFIERAKGTKHPSIEEELREARVRCGDIENIYHRSLREWFNGKNITDQNRNYILNLFTRTLDHDFVFVKEVETTTEALRAYSEEISSLLDNSKFGEASTIIREFSLDLIPRLQKLGNELKGLLELREGFGTKIS